MDEKANDRQALIERIAENLDRFDDDTLSELDRLTDPSTDLVREPLPRAHGSLTRRELIAAALAGGALVAITGGGAVLASRGGDSGGGAVAVEETGLKALLNAHERLESVAIDGVARAGLQTVGAAMIEAGTAAAGLRAGVDVVTGTLSVPVQDLDTGFLSMLRQNVLEPARATADALDELTETWRLEMATPIQTRLDERDAVRRQIATLKALPTANVDA